MTLGVKASYPEPPEAKLTPVKRSLGCKVGSLYAGRSSLIPNSSTAQKKKKANKRQEEREQNLDYIVNWFKTMEIKRTLNEHSGQFRIWKLIRI